MTVASMYARAFVLAAITSLACEAIARNTGGTLRRVNHEIPPRASLHEEDPTIVTTPLVPIFGWKT